MKKNIIFLLSIILTMNCVNLAAQATAPTDFKATPVGISLACHLSWTNPVTTVAGNPLNSIKKIVIERNNEIIKEIENPAVGALMNFTDNTVPTTDNYHYVLYAINDDGKGAEADGYADIGDGCYFRFVLQNSTGSMQGWKGSYIIIAVNEENYCTVTLQGNYFAEKIIFIPSGALTFTWVLVGNYGPACEFDIYNPLDELLFSIEGIFDEIGMFLEYENKCSDGNQDCDPATNLLASTDHTTVHLTWEGAADSYFIMKNGTVIDEVTETHFLDEDIEDGFYSYCIMANYSDGCTSPLVCDDITILSVVEHKSNIVIYPNPARNIVTISGTDMINVKIFNNMGQLILIQNNTNTINVSTLTNGIYILSIELPAGYTTQKKLIINH